MLIRIVLLITDVLALPLFFLVYSYVVAAIPVNTSRVPPEKGITIFVHTNGFHTDIILPVNEAETGIYWLHELSDTNLQRQQAKARWVAFGWGDEGFYLDSYNNTFPGMGTCCKALFWPSPSLMHVVFYQNGFTKTASCVPIVLRKSEYQTLCKGIRESFSNAANGQPQRIAAPGYWGYDYFFRANNSYHLFRSCNGWTNNCLKKAGLRASLQATFADQVMHRLHWNDEL